MEAERLRFSTVEWTMTSALTNVRASAVRNPVAIAPGSDNATDRPLTQAVLTFDALGDARASAMRLLFAVLSSQFSILNSAVRTAFVCMRYNCGFVLWNRLRTG